MLLKTGITQTVSSSWSVLLFYTAVIPNPSICSKIQLSHVANYLHNGGGLEASHEACLAFAVISTV